MIDALIQRGTLNSGRPIDYAFGLAHGTYRGLPTVSHSGGDAGYRANFLRFPDEGVTFLCMSNLADINAVAASCQAADIYLAGRLVQKTARAPANETVGARGGDLTELAGWYWQEDDEFGWRIERDALDLVLRFGPDAHTALYSVGHGRDRNAEDSLRLCFSPDDDSGRGRLTAQWDDGHDPFDLYKTEEFAPAASDLASFEGLYVSDEVMPRHRITAHDGQLVLLRAKFKPDSLRPLIRDYFRGAIGGLRFVRGQDGQVRSFVLNKGRIRGMEFVRDLSLRRTD